MTKQRTELGTRAPGAIGLASNAGSAGALGCFCQSGS